MAGSALLILGWRLGDKLFGTEVTNVVHIEEDLRTHRIPRPAPGVAGLAHYQDHVLPVMDLAYVLLGESDHRWMGSTKHLIFQSNTRFLAARVDSVVQIHPVATDELETWQTPPEHPAARFVRAVLPLGDTTLWLVDVRRLIRETMRSHTTPAKRD